MEIPIPQRPEDINGREIAVVLKASISRKVVGNTDAFTAVVGAEGHALCAVQAEGDAIDCSTAEGLGAACLIGSSGTEAGMVGFPFLPLSKTVLCLYGTQGVGHAL